ncbi:putative copii coat assembly protein sec16 protein [Eutypa lata UCREL1]|uniref:COPII coat assembly protein SEC16 n=1 Tax=Eutypa lata (strain UCR-EL1) TaxID=1287681 RepID=M7T1H0_EUTLA|nr:putative copii coat assembly protein sec16 protein [Eutypa lata UCREL1]
MSPGADLTAISSSMTNMQADTIDSSAMEQIRKCLLSGDREKAVWAAVDKRLWGHAMLIANTTQSADLYKQVAQEFIKKEVNYPGHNNESLAALYSVLSTNFDEYGRAEAAHICYIFARTHAVFGGLDDSNAHFVLVGADHRRQADQFAKDTEALLLSEVYEYGLSLPGGLNVLQGCPHLAAYKLQHAATLAEHGFKDKALQYCDAITNAMMSQTKRSPYYNLALESSVEDLAKRLKLAPKEGSSSWISKPSMDKVSSGMWNRFNKFVAGEDTDAAGEAPTGENGGEVGPFARIAGGTPTISPSPSTSNFEVYANGLSGSTPSAPTIAGTRAGSRYAPAATQASPYDPNDDARGRPKKKTIFDDDDDIPALKQPQEKSKSEKDRENEELFRKVAEEEAKRAAEAKPAKKGWGFGGWFGGGGAKKEEQIGNKPIKAKLGEQSSFVYDPDLKRWINKKPGAENTPAKTATPPPPRSNSASRLGTGTPPPPMASHSAPPPSLSRPPSAAPPLARAGLTKPPSQESLLAPPMMMRSVSNQSAASAISDASASGGPPGPARSPSMPPRPATSLSNASSIDDLLGAAGARRGASRKPRKSGRYVDVMAK